MYLKKTLKFTNRNFLYLLLISLPAAILLTAGGSPFTVIDFFIKLFSDINNGVTKFSFMSIFQNFSIIKVDNAINILLVLLSLVFLGFIFSLVERNMKYNTLSLGSIRSLFLDSMIMVVPAGIFVILLIEVVGLVVSGFIALFAMFATGWFWYALCLIITALAYIPLLSFICCLFCWIPCMSIDGFRLFAAASLSTRMISKQHAKISTTVFSALLVCGVILYFINLVGVVSYITASFLINIIFCMIVPVYCYVMYFELAEIPYGKRKGSK